MVADPEKQSNTIGDNSDAYQVLQDQSLNGHQASIRRLESILYLLLMGHGFLILMSNGNPPALYGVLALLGLNLLGVFINKHENPTPRLLRALFATGVVGVLSVFAIDSANMLIAWFYLILVYYSFALSSRHQYVVMVAVPFGFTLSYIMNPGERGITEFLIRLSLMIISGGLMGYLQRVVNRSINQHIDLIFELQQVHDNTAQQLEERTVELQQEIQVREQAQAKLIEERQLLQTIIDTFPSRLFVKDRDSHFTLVNRWSLERLSLLNDLDTVIGKSDFDFFPHFAERTYADEQRLMETGMPLIDWEETTLDDKGVEHHYLISKVPMYHPETNEIIGLVGVTTEVTPFKETQIALHRSEESLKKQIQERQQTQSQLAEKHQILQTVIDTFPNSLYVKDRESRFILVNRVCVEHLGAQNADDVVGKSDVDFFPHFADRTYVSEQHLMETRESIIDWEETILDDEGVERHYLISKIPMHHHETNEIIGLVGVTADITPLKKTQIALSKSEESLKLFQQRLKALNQITIDLTRIEAFDELVYQSIKLAVEHLGFSRLSCRFIDPDNPNRLIGGCRVDDLGEIIMAKYETIPLPLDHPLSEIMRGNKPNHIVRDAVVYDADFQPIGHGDKAFSALLDGDTITGFLYADTLLDGTSFTQSQFELLNIYGATLGALFNRQQIQEALQLSEEEALHFQQQLKQLHEITIELESVDSLDELCRKTIVLGREKLGFERLGIWLTHEDDPVMRRGMWGTDKYGNLRDERDMILPIPDVEAIMITEGDVVTFENDDRDVFDHFDDNPMEFGWNLVGLMWDGTKRIGWLYADNVLYGQSLTQNQHELFRLYVATVGLLCGRQMADEQLRQSEIRYRAITEASSDIIVIVNQQSIITYISPSLKVVMGIEPQVIIGQPVTQVIHKDDVLMADNLLQQCFKLPRLITRMDEFRVRHANGQWVHMEAVMTSMIDNPIVNGVLISGRDITQRLIAEDRKRIAERERERASVLRQFISDISHDFRTPLSTISTTSYLLKNGSADHIERRVDMIDQQISRIANLIDNLIIITKLDETSQIPMEKVNINTILESIPHRRSYRIEEKQLTLTLDLQSHLPMITGNVSFLHDAIYHLIDNAIQFCDFEDSIIIESYHDQKQVIIKIADTGGGIAEEDLPFIFDRLYRADKARNTHTGGSGLGLAITHRIIDLHKGNIKISSQLDEGTLVHLFLPFEPVTIIDGSSE
jgi:PAS domain S-box-containing protein